MTEDPELTRHIADLRNEEVSVRRDAAETLGKMGDVRAVEPLLTAAVSDTDAIVRSSAAMALQHVDEARAVKSLIGVLCEANWFRRWYATEALVRIGKNAVPALVAALEDPDSNVRRHAARALGKIGEARAVKPLAAALRDGHEEVRREAAQALREIGDVVAVTSLIEALRDREAHVRCFAVDSLIGTLRNVRRFTPDALAELGGSGVEALTAALRDPASTVRCGAANALGEIHDARALEPLIQALNDPDPHVREAAVRSLMGTRDPRAAELLIAALDHDNPKVRSHAAKVLGALRDIRGLEPLITVMRDEDPEVRDSAASALVAIGDARVIGSLIPALRDQNPHIRTLAARVITQIERSLQHGRPGTLRGGLFPAEERLAAEQAEWHTEMAESMGGRSRWAPRLKNAQFSVYHPWQIKPVLWHTLLAYLHNQLSRAEVDADSMGHLQAEAHYARKTAPAKTDISEGAEILVVPEMPGCRFNPPTARVAWLENWHRIEFRMQALPTIAGFELDKAVNGRIAFYVESLLVGEVNIWTFVTDEAGPLAAETLTNIGMATADAYPAIFASYSHEDTAIVEALATAYKVPGMSFLRDIEALRSGEKWQPRLLELIEQADVFQLYWSIAAKRSRHVEQEWRHALVRTKARLGFIRPVYWQTPMPEPPPELADIHFSYYPGTSS
jgi:HEAT repeat protein